MKVLAGFCKERKTTATTQLYRRMKGVNEVKDETLALSKEQKAAVTAMLSAYLEENFEVEAGNLAAELFADFLGAHLGPYYYNKGILDALAFLTAKTEDMYALLLPEERE